MSRTANQYIVICGPHVDGWQKFFRYCPVCKCRRLTLGEFQDYYGMRTVCLTCGNHWLDGEAAWSGKREQRERIIRAKERIQQYLREQRPQGLKKWFDKTFPDRG